MRKLHLVGLTTDQKGLIFTARRGSDSGGYVVALDAEVLNAIARAQGRPNGASVGPQVRPGGEYTPGPGSQTRRRGLLTPREMQARLRAGRSVEDVAEEADVEVEWVERFAVPILAEQAQVVELARTLVYVNAKAAASAHPLDESVAWNLLDRGARVTDDVFDSSWTAYQLHDQVWMIRFAYRSRGRAQEARWELDVGTGELVARNKVASELAYVEPGARLRRPPPPEAEEEPATAPPAATSRAARSATRRAIESATVVDTDDTEDTDDDTDEDIDDDDVDEDDGELQVGSSVEVDDLDDGEEESDDEDGDEVDVAAATPGAAVDAPPAEVAAVDTAEGPAPAESPSEAPAGDAAAPTARPGARTRAKPAAASAPGAAGAEAPPASAAARPKPKAKAKARPKAKKVPPTPIPPVETPAPVRGVLVSTGRVTRPAPPRGLFVSSPRMRGLTGGVGSTPSAPKPAADPPARAKAPAPATPPDAAGPPASPAEPKASHPEPSEAPSPPGGAGVRKAVAQVTSVRVAASRALVARAMLPKPAPTVVSRPTLGGRVVNQPTSERPPVPIRPRPPAPTPTPEPAPAARPPLRLQPDTSEQPPPALRSAPRPDDGPSAAASAPDPARSPFVPRPAPTGRPERPSAGRPPAAAPRPAGRPGPRPEPGRPEPGRGGGRPAPRPASGPGARPEGRPEPVRAAGGRPEGGRPEARRPEARRPEESRPEARRPELRRPEARRPEARRPEERPAEERRPNDRRLDDRARPRPAPSRAADPGDDGVDEADDRSGRNPAVGGRPRIAAQPAADWRPSTGRARPPSGAPPGPPVVAPPTGIDEPRPRRRLRRPPR
ncbi:MAG: hypothetical protein QOG43_3605 [Actinomycetota bacterium]|nr:hypothetical protein [Actinomycetota bacterium]